MHVLSCAYRKGWICCDRILSEICVLSRLRWSFFVLGVKMGGKGIKECVQMAGLDSAAENCENTAELRLVITISKEHCSSEVLYSHQPL